MKYIIWTLAIFILLVLQGGILLQLRLDPVNLLLLMVVISLLFSDFDFALFLSLSAGTMLDFVSGSSGIALISIVVVFFAMHFVINNILDREPTLLILFSSVAAGTAGYFLAYFLINQLFGVFGDNVALNLWGYFASDLPKALLLNLIFTYPVFQYYTFVEYLIQKLKKNGAQSV